MTYKIPAAQFIPGAQVEAPLYSILRAGSDGQRHKVPRGLQLLECDRQARIAALHIDRAWEITAKYSGMVDDTRVWAELQGAMTAGIILSRMLRPTGVRARNELTKAKAQRQSEQRGEVLRDLLDLSENSPLLKISTIRDPIEHFDERIDAVVDQGTAAVTDFFLAKQGYLASGPRQTPDGRSIPPTVALRVFAPWPGLLIFGDVVFDLFTYEEALHKMIDEDLPRAKETVIAEEKHWNNSHFGSAMQVAWDPAEVEERRERWSAYRFSRGLGAPTDF